VNAPGSAPPVQAAIAPALTAQTTVATPVNLYVIPSGSDANPGTATLPFRTLEKVNAAVAALVTAGLSSDVIVNMGSGSYVRSAAWSITSAVSGTPKYRVIFKKWNAADTPTIHGGIAVKNWVRSPRFPGKPIWEAAWTSSSITRHLFRNDQRLKRAHIPVPPGLTISEFKNGFSGAPASWAQWKEPTLVEFVFRPVGKMFTEHRCTVASVALAPDGASSTVFIKQSCFAWALERKVDVDAIAVIENVAEGLDTNDEWVCSLADQKLYYYTTANLSSSFALTATVAQTILAVNGAKYVTFQGIRFRFSEWLQVNNNGGGYVERSNGWFRTSTSFSVQVSYPLHHLPVNHKI